MKGLDAGRRFVLRRDGLLEKELLEVMRVMLGSEEETEEVDEEDVRGLHEKDVRGMQLEMDVLGTLGQMMEDKLGKLQSMPEVDDGEVREEVRRMCDVYRRGECRCSQWMGSS